MAVQLTFLPTIPEEDMERALYDKRNIWIIIDSGS